MDFRGENVGALEEAGGRKREWPFIDGVADVAIGRGRGADRAIGHAGAKDFDAVEINHRAIIDDLAQAQPGTGRIA